MTSEEFSVQFDVLYNNISSNQAPGLNDYEKSVFLTKAQDEVVKNYFNARSRGNTTQEGFDDSQKRQIDFSKLTTVSTITTFGSPLLDPRSSSKSVDLPTNLLFPINEIIEATKGVNKDSVLLQVVPLKYSEYARLMSKPFKWPLKSQAWRLINFSSSNKADLITSPAYSLSKYIIRYIKKPTPIILSDIGDLKIDGLSEETPCILDSVLHEEILQRAVELAKAAWASTGQDNTQVILQTGLRSE